MDLITQFLRRFADQYPLSGKFKADVLSNVVSLVLISFIGFLLNVIILKTYGVAALGVFSQVYSIYILLSQLAVGGIQLSVLKYIPEYLGKQEEKECRLIYPSAFVCVALNSTLVMLVCMLAVDQIGAIFDSQGVRQGLPYILPALVFFSLNKVLISFHNGARRMRRVALFLSIRFVLALMILLFLIAVRIRGEQIPLVFSITEILLFMILLMDSIRIDRWQWTTGMGNWIKRHYSFAVKAVLGNTLNDLNARMDVILLGILSTDQRVGLYSIPALLLLAFHELAAILRKNINPIITDIHYHQEKSVLAKFISDGKSMCYRAMATIGIPVIFSYPFIIYLFRLDPKLYEGWVPFIILMTGSLLAIGYRPFYQIFNQTGFPGYQTIFFFISFLVNIVLNWLLIPLWGIRGAALSVAVMLMMERFVFRRMTLWAIRLKV